MPSKRDPRADPKQAIRRAAMASEGWTGGYAQALRDVQLALDGNIPSTRNYWDTPREDKS